MRAVQFPRPSVWLSLAKYCVVNPLQSLDSRVTIGVAGSDADAAVGAAAGAVAARVVVGRRYASAPASRQALVDRPTDRPTGSVES